VPYSVAVVPNTNCGALFWGCGAKYFNSVAVNIISIEPQKYIFLGSNIIRGIKHMDKCLHYLH
jgi:hypothetical protein